MPETATRRRGPYAKTAERRRQIVEEAYRLFATRGYHGSSLREVATAAGMSQSNLLHHFASKEELLLAVLERRDDLGGAEEPSAKEGTFDERIVAQAQHNESIPGLIALYSVLSAEATTVDHPGRDFFLRRYDALRAGYEDEFEALRRQGRLREGVEPATAAASVIALWEGIQLQWLYTPAVIDVGATLRAYLDLVIVETPKGARRSGD
ncbi:TetR/AcrR family transcriptional regulator [Leifsonia sp. NPDC058248]|uniref:TetR/AcrR family transcriptional regulator n=1 Tax=Leifsonia sp. NPDC058248 TaxID=3346402 RepID=UPI0036DDAABB